MSVTTAAAAFERYTEFYEQGRLVQSSWHETDSDGRQLACALGVLGDDVSSPRDCPAAIMPRWLAQMVPAFFDRQKKADALDWGKRFYAALARVGGSVPFSVVHDWHANTVTVLGIDAAEKRGRDTTPHTALQELHKRALGGEKIAADEWRPVLKNAYAYAYANAYAYAYAYANADANAYADANANAYANAYADAYADANANAYANAYAWKKLSDGMVAALERLPAAIEAEAA